MIDLRSDTVTKPTPEMLALFAAPSLRNRLGDDVFGEDTLTNEFERQVADLLGKEAALFVPSGTMGNQLCVKLSTSEGDEVILESGAHIFNYETAAPAVLSRVQLKPLDGENGILTAEQIDRAIRPVADWYPRTSLVCLENTHNRAGGIIYPIEDIERISELCRSKKLRLHLDGARLWNACAATKIAPKTYAQFFDTVSVCFSKGLGAPAGSAIAGTQSDIQKARRWRKLWGGGMRQSGVLAAMAKFALDNHLDRLLHDHRKALCIANAFAAHPTFKIDMTAVQTNIVAVDVSNTGLSERDVVERFREKGVLISSIKKNYIRLVTHLDVSMNDAENVAEIIQTF
ncbi:MAG: hypothetical protein HY22_14280 [[Candidatus Thermochlorobacteriaceae] bacterium GBChlB]|nr:MAG: hypothetical protein HY22_14280 [[Candidatus Thermochlorobacteriaceae] bacterium GBChlB]